MGAHYTLQEGKEILTCYQGSWIFTVTGIYKENQIPESPAWSFDHPNGFNMRAVSTLRRLSSEINKPAIENDFSRYIRIDEI